MSRPLAALALALIALTACEDSVQFRLRLAWQRVGDPQACPTMSDGTYSCEAIPLSCDVRVRVRIVGAASDQKHYSECFRIENDGDVCQLADLPITPRAIPNEMVRIQVIVWTVDELERSQAVLAEDGCPVTTVFAGGLPRLGEPIDPLLPPEAVPALGGEAYFAVGKSPTATVTLGCPAYDDLNAPSCRDNSVTLDATILNPSTLASVSSTQGADMEVRFGAPVANGDGTFRVDSNVLSPALARTTAGPLTWQGVLQTAPVGVQCLRADAQGVAAPTIACFDAPAADAQRRIFPTGFLVGRELLRQLLVMQTLVDLPEPGMVLGVVVDARRQPVEGATVTVGGGATVFYPDDDVQGVRVDTGKKGLFVSRNAPYGAAWHATTPGGLADIGTARGGLVDDHVSVVLIELDGTVPVLDAGIGAPDGGDAGGGVDAGTDDGGVDAP